jgi:hypothetical protein
MRLVTTWLALAAGPGRAGARPQGPPWPPISAARSYTLVVPAARLAGPAARNLTAGNHPPGTGDYHPTQTTTQREPRL